MAAEAEGEAFGSWGMIEIFFIIGLLGWLAALVLEHLYALPSFAGVAAGLLLTPVVGLMEYAALKRHVALQGVGTRREATPPEKFYWPLKRSRMLRQMAICGVLAPIAWVLVFRYPVGSQDPVVAITGGLAGAVAALSGGRFLGGLALYFQASQWYDWMTPWVVGWCRRILYRLSDNPEFLGNDGRVRRRGEKRGDDG